MTPQQKRVLAAAKAFNGTCSADWIDGMGPDGKGKISRVPARIEELAELYGCEFEAIGRRGGTKVYRLVSGPEGDGVERTVGISDATRKQERNVLGAATARAASASSDEGSRKAPVRSGDAGLISRASAGGSLSADGELSEAPASGGPALRTDVGLPEPVAVQAGAGVSESPPTLFDLPVPGPVSPYEEAA